jgi:molybdopterin-guanine dinucleotide biosynthesis protein A
VLAGGAGRRLGRPKATVAFAGRTLVERAVATLEAWCSPVIVVSRPEIPLPALSVPVCFDRPGPDAPLTGLATGLSALDTDDALVLACDLPLAGPVVRRLAATVNGTAAVARASGDGRVQPLCARYPRRTALAACEGLLTAGEARLLPLVEALRPRMIDASAEALANINSPADLARLFGFSPPPGGC